MTVFSGFLGAIAAAQPDEVPAALDALDRARGQGEILAGYFAYELGYALEPHLGPLMPSERALPLLWFGRFQDQQVLEGVAIGAWLDAQIQGRAYAGPLKPLLDQAGYAERFARAMDYIRAGDIYQVNLTFQADFAFAGDPMALYRTLRPHSQAGFGGVIADGTRTLLSLSPELFFTVEGGVLTARPMKGTSPRDADANEDSRLRAQLQASEKDRAENLMIVDLIRNDLSRVSATGSVRVGDLFAVESYPTVHQMVSTVHGSLREGVRSSDIVRALFPCGSVTGTPKIRAMEIIRELEDGPRGLYCGAMGAFFPDGSSRFNVAIRTLTLEDGRGSMGIGGAVVADSEAASEYQECLIKTRFFSEPRKSIGLIETLRFDQAVGFVREDLHLTRMARSATAFDIPFDEEAAKTKLRDGVRGSTSVLRVRLFLNESGRFVCSCQSLGPDASHWRYAISDKRVQSTDPLLRHKIDWRAFYDDEYTALHKQTECDEVLFLNERGEIVEGSRTNVFLRFGDSLVTPPLDAGPLDGVLRRALLDDPAARCREGRLTLADLGKADSISFGNSLRGLVSATPITAPPG